MDTYILQPSSGSLVDNLRNALKKYHLQADNGAELKDTYERYLARNRKITTGYTLSESIVNAFSSFNIAPSGSSSRYLSAVPNRSDIEAIQSDWNAVGEDLTFVLAGQVLNSKIKNEQK